MPFDDDSTPNDTTVANLQTSTAPSAQTPTPATATAAATAPAQAPMQAPVAQPGQQQPQQPQTVSNPSAQPQQAQQQSKHPWAQRIRDVAEVLAGGKRYNETIDQNGNRVYTPQPLSKSQIGMAIALEALSGGMAGLKAGRGQGPGAAGMAGFQQGMQQRQQQINQQDEQANKDFYRRAATAEANMRMLNAAIQIGRLNKDAHDQAVSSYADQLADDEQNAPGVIKGKHLSETEAKDIQKYPFSEYLRIPDGTVPRLDGNGHQVYMNSQGRIVPEGTPGAIAQWDNTYTLKESGKTKLRDENGQPKQWVKDAVAWGLPGHPPSLLNAAPSAEISAASAAKAQHQIVMLGTLQHELNGFASSFGTDKNGKPTMEPIDLKAALKADPRLLKAVEQFQRSAGMSTQPDLQINAMRNDPKTAPYVGQIMRLFGADALEQYKSNREARESAEKKHAEAVATGEYALRQSEVTKNLAEAAAAKDRPGSTGVVSKEDAHAIALAVHDGLQPPDLKGLYRSSGLVKAELAKMGYNQTLAISDWNATQRRLSTMNGPQQVRLQQAVEFAYESLPLLRQKYQEWKQAAGVSGFKAFNKTALEAMKQLPGNAGAAAQALEQQIADLTSEMGTVYKGGNSSTDDSLALAAKNFSADWNEETFNRAYDLAEQNLRIRKNSIALTVKPTGVSETSPYTPNAQQNASADNRQSGTSATTVQPVYAKNPQTGQRVMSIDGGRTWQPAQ
ncbi:MAG: hypothetical protein ACJ71Q_09040 [Terriglobales bacterium]